MKKIGYYLTILCISSGCITPLEQDPSDFEPYLVVEGFINDEFGPHKFNITEVTTFAGVTDGGAIIPLDATVEIIDQNGLRTPVKRENVQRKDLFNANPQGCSPASNIIQVRTPYQTPADFKGEIGNTYTLEIVTKGKTYRSVPQTIIATPKIDSLIIRFKELPSLDDVIIPSGVEVQVLLEDPAEQTNYYSWIINGIYQISTPNKPLPACCIYDPADGREENCWIIETDIQNNEIAFSDETINGQRAAVIVGFIEDDGLRFASSFLPAERKYYIEVEQYQIDKQAFEFYDDIKKLIEIDGDIFDPLPLSVRGNIQNVDNPEEIVIGHFGAYSVQKKGIFVSESLLKFKQSSSRPCGDCRVRPGAQVEVPAPFQ